MSVTCAIVMTPFHPHTGSLLTTKSLVDKAKSNVKGKSDGALAFELRNRGIKADASTISRWRNMPLGHGPEWFPTMILLEIAEWLSPEALTAKAADEARAASEREEGKHQPPSTGETSSGDLP